MSLSEKISSRKELEQVVAHYSFLVSGSDQVWNRKWTGGEDTYLQDFHHQNEKKVSYAASFGVTEIPKEWGTYKSLLSEFAAVSVREEVGQKILKQQFGINSEVHLDPTLLLPREEWDQLASKKRIKKPYVLVYMVPYQESVIKKAKRIAEEKNLDIYIVCKSLKHINKYYKGISAVEDVISLFKYADYVVTNSFHGTAFSVIYQRKFFAVLDNKWAYNVRSAQLISSCGITYLKNGQEYAECFDVDWNHVEEVLNKERIRVSAYFTDMFKKDAEKSI